MPQRSATGGSELQANLFSASPAGTPGVGLVEDPMEIQGSSNPSPLQMQQSMEQNSRRAMTASPSVFSVGGGMDQAWNETATGWKPSSAATTSVDNPIGGSRSSSNFSRPPLLSHDSGPAWVSSIGTASPSLGWNQDVSSAGAEDGNGSPNGNVSLSGWSTAGKEG